MNNLRALADLALVISQLKTIINTSGMSQFAKPKLSAMKVQLNKLELQFIEMVLEDPEPSVWARVSAAREQVQKSSVSKSVVMSHGTPVVVDPTDPQMSVAAQAKDVSKTSMGEHKFQVTKLSSLLPSELATEVPGPPIKADLEEAVERSVSEKPSSSKKKKNVTAGDEEGLAELRARLAEEKKKLAAKMKTKKAATETNG